MTENIDAVIDEMVSPTEQQIAKDDLLLFADPGPSDTEGHSPPVDLKDVDITNDELKQMTIDVVAGKTGIRPSSPYAAKVLERLKAEISLLPTGTIIEIPPDNP